MELGRRLISELGEDREPEITVKWMACHLAEVMTAAEADPSRLDECCDLILQLWRARQSIPSGDPLERYGPVLAALEAQLGRDADFLRFRRPLGVWKAKTGHDWASLTHSIQKHVRILTLAAIDLAVEVEGLRRDALVDIAHEADPDPETSLLMLLRVVGVDRDGTRSLFIERDFVVEALDQLEATLASYREYYEEQSPSKKE